MCFGVACKNTTKEKQYRFKQLQQRDSVKGSLFHHYMAFLMPSETALAHPSERLKGKRSTNTDYLGLVTKVGFSSLCPVKTVRCQQLVLFYERGQKSTRAQLGFKARPFVWCLQHKSLFSDSLILNGILVPPDFSYLQVLLKGYFHAIMFLTLRKTRFFGFSPVNFIFNNLPTTLSVRIVSHGEDWKTIIRCMSFITAQPH